jgi:hypothetical protein
MRRYQKNIIILILMMVQVSVFAQSPDMYPHPVPQPIGIDAFNIILYFVAPLLIIVAFFLYRNWQNKERKKNKK